MAVFGPHQPMQHWTDVFVVVKHAWSKHSKGASSQERPGVLESHWENALGQKRKLIRIKNARTDLMTNWFFVKTEIQINKVKKSTKPY